MSNSGITEIAYHFADASVPPDYHRSYGITVTASEVRIVVDSYGEILADETFAVTAERFDELRGSLSRRRIMNCVLTEDEGCTGGTSEKISYRDDQRQLFSGTVHHCGGKDTGDLCGEISAFAEDVKKLVPDLENLLQ